MAERQQLGPEAKRNLLIVAGVFGAAILVAGYFVMNTVSKAGAPAVEATQVAEVSGNAVDKNTGETGINSEELAQLNQQRDAEAARQAAAEGRTYIPALIAGEKELIDKPKADQDKAPPPLDPWAELEAKQAAKNEANLAARAAANGGNPSGSQDGGANGVTRVSVPLSEEQTDLLGSLMAGIKPTGSVSGTTTTFDKPAKREATRDREPSASNEPSATAKSGDKPVKPCPYGEICNANGQILIAAAGSTAFAQIEMAIDTDEPSPVFGKILTGNKYLKGRSIIGAFTQNPNLSVGITFSKVSGPNGTMGINAVVVDSKSGRAALAGRVDHKYFERFGLPMITAGAGKFAELTAAAGTTVTVTQPAANQTITQTGNTMNTGQIGAAALAAGLGQAQTSMEAISAAAKPATRLRNNIGVELRFLEDVWL